ncbi:MAG: hypothetical protein QY306_01595 [Anaerolineales bacterium]|nr:MAG: hypothetical protein QY306_01595 [Anaerolineales bacterium]
MKSMLSILGVVVFLAGLVWFLQGINLLPGSFMTGDPQWAINGGIAMVVGAALYFIAKRNG